MKSNRIYRAVAIVAAAFLAAGALGGCGTSVGERPKLVALGPIGGESEEGMEDLEGLEDLEALEEDAADVDETAPSPEEMDLSVETGRCFTTAEVVGADSALHMVTKDCAESHDAEFFFTFDSAVEAWNADDLEAEAYVTCKPEFESYLGIDLMESDLDFSYFEPSDASWASGDRQVTCFILEPGLIKGSAKGSGR